MSLSEIGFWATVKRQFFFKVSSYKNAFSTLVVLQVLAILLSMGGTSSMGSGSTNVFVSVSYYSSSAVIVFSMIWCFITAILITTRAYRNDDFAFVTNRLTQNMANILFLLTASVIAAITANLSGYAVRVAAYALHGVEFVASPSLFNTPGEWLMSVSASFLYIFLLGSLGYILGTLTHLNRLFMFIIPAVFFGGMFTGAANDGFITQTVLFFNDETSFVLFMIKVIVTSSLLFILASWITNKTEVRL